MLRLNRDDLFFASTESIARLAKYLEIAPERFRGESDNSYRARCVGAIQKWEKDQSRKPKE